MHHYSFARVFNDTMGSANEVEYELLCISMKFQSSEEELETRITFLLLRLLLEETLKPDDQ
jgi:hypothetical protein